MASVTLTTLATTGFAVALLHAAIPTHWLPFVLVGRARQWSGAKTLSIVLAAGTGHILLTCLLGFLIAWCGLQFEGEIAYAFPWLAGGVLLAAAGYYSWRQIRGTGICRHGLPVHSGPRCHHEREAEPSEPKDDWAAISGLFVMLTLSPCEGFLPVFLSGLPFGWDGFLILSATLAVGTLPGMLLFAYLTIVGLDHLNLPRLERYDAGLLAGVFSVLGVLMLALEH